jgi:hypothetical protein
MNVFLLYVPHKRRIDYIPSIIMTSRVAEGGGMVYRSVKDHAEERLGGVVNWGGFLDDEYNIAVVKAATV